MDHWRVCLIMPFLDEARHLPAVLASLEAQTYDRDRLYLIAVDNGSMDGGSEVVRDWLARSDVAGQVIRTEVRSIPHALNRALAHVHPDDYVVRVDAHTI
ncbi:MAG: glycosyltransferase [Candidatus Eremiobacteraeota bacterium]|nr:glycosyltransferase [Candidatus Eremiobacteraeota bacterium]